ncbi:hypothetical protein BGZ46_006103, partial [Entomortierella lignicola]
MTQKRYLPTQKDFLAWLEEGSFEAGINPTVPIINWLHHVMATRNLAWTTVMNMKSAILALFADTRCITNDPLYQQFIRAGRVETVHHTRQEDYDISPVIQYFRGLDDNAAMDLAILTQKLCWLLGVCGFMRPDDIRCTDVQLSSMIRDKLQLAVIFPKEKRNGQRIIKHITIGGHPDPALCPVKAYTAYLARLDEVDIRVPHPKDPTREYTPLIRFTKDHSKPATSTTIAGHMNRVSSLMVPKGSKAPKLRALGSTLAAISGVPIADIMVQGNWSSPKVFEKHYRLS